MESSKVDYNLLAARYNERYEGRPLSGVGRALEQLRTGRVLEAGCGTGHWLREQDYGVDLHFEMLRQAKARRACADAGALPFRSGSFDLVFAVNAIHHFPRRSAFVAEARRVLRPGGALAVIGMSPRLQRDRWWIYEYFDGTFEVDVQRFPEWGALLDDCLATGFRSAEWSVVETVQGTRTGAEIWQDPFLPKHSASQLALLTDEQYQTGLDRIRRAIERDPNVQFKWQLTLGMLVVR